MFERVVLANAVAAGVIEGQVGHVHCIGVRRACFRTDQGLRHRVINLDGLLWLLVLRQDTVVVRVISDDAALPARFINHLA